MRKEIPIGQHVLLGLWITLFVVITGTAFWVWQGGWSRQGGWQERPLEGLKRFGRVPDFSLTERSGRPVTLSELKGKTWIADFIYTHCPDSCPIQSAQMRELQTEFINERDLRLVSVTVDPELDTPKVLSQYARRFGADPERWLFLTGEKEAIYRLAQGGFQLGAAEIPRYRRPASGATHAHSPRFVLIDRNAEIRGYYTSTEVEAMMRLRRDLKTLLGAK